MERAGGILPTSWPELSLVVGVFLGHRIYLVIVLGVEELAVHSRYA